MASTPILFCDLDGVLLDSETDLSWYTSSIEKTLSHCNLPMDKETVSSFHFNNVENFKTICEHLSMDPKMLWPIRNMYYTQEKISAMKKSVIHPFSDVSSLYQLKEGFTIGIISNSPQSVVDFFVSEFHFSDLFSINIGRGKTIWDIDHIKPDVYLFTKAKPHIHGNPVFYIGDRESDRIFAQKTDMRYYHLNRLQNQQKSYASLNEIVDELKKDILQ